MTAVFNQVQSERNRYNRFDLTHDIVYSAQIGKLIPSCVMECIPGDKVNLGCNMLVRFQPLQAPVMGRFDCTTEYYFVPRRLLLPQWDDFITQKAELVLPYVTSANTLSDEAQLLLDYLGVPPIGTSPNGVNISAFPLAAYQMIYNEYYRDQRLVTEVNYGLTPGSNNANTDLFVLRNKAYPHDYFTSALPEAQAGVAVDMPLGTVELVDEWGTSPVDFPFFKKGVGGAIADTGDIAAGTAGPDGLIEDVNSNSVAYDPNGTLEVEPTTINTLRRAFRIQEFLELLNRGGQRMKEFMKSMFNVNYSDKRAQRPEYITGVKSPVIISEVLNTTGIVDELPQGNMAGHAVAIGDGAVGSYYCEDYGYIIGITHVKPLARWYQGIPKHYLKTDVYDFFTPKLANIGEMAIQKQELYAYNSGAFPTATFGYTPQYSDYRWLQSRVAGNLRTSLSYWFPNRILEGAALNQDFIEVKPEDCERIFAVDDEPPLIIHQVNIIRASRQIPVFGTPML